MNNQRIFVDRSTTWHAIGKSVEECKNMEQVLKASGLDYEVTKEPISLLGSNKAIPNRFVTCRPENGGLKIYDVVSDKYQIIQNRDAFDFVNYMGDDFQFEKAGETKSGMVYIIGKLPEVNILGDAFTPHVIFRNGFDGKIKITAAITPLRLVCQNQFNFAFKNASNATTIRHVGNAEKKLAEAKEILRLSADYMSELNTMAEQFAKIKMNKDRLQKVTNLLFPLPEGVEMNAYKRKHLEDQRAAFLKAHEAEDNANFRGTAWGLVNAYTDMITHKEPAGNRDDKLEGKFVNTTFKVTMNPIINAIEAVA
jgi:phage/plasmid-like protein (TIGR03299 family)